ncbi:centrosomal AT-AC splicing factor-like isoform X2 [Ruditapes philippinarum]|nr:centrosomal AT-AC splicing factor-like isoform X2 [Ruditapes philippinarum]
MMFETDAKFWCYFCEEQFAKHEIVENCTVVGAGLLEHISSKDHKAGMEQFFWDNLMKKELKPLFVLSAEDLYIFKKAAFLAVKKRQKLQELARKKVAEKISLQGMNRLSDSAIKATSLEDLPGNALSRTNQTGSGISQTGSGTSLARRDGISAQQEARYHSQNTVSGRKMTYSAKAEGLAYIKPATQYGNEEGNVHSGGLPPWLQSDDDSSKSSVIGPTIKDIQKHLEQEKKAKLPANRVGASFDHTTTRSHDWLPSFGRVWSKGRRLQSKQHFEREMKKGQRNEKRKQTRTSTVSSYSESCSGTSTTSCNSGNQSVSSLPSHSSNYHHTDSVVQTARGEHVNFTSPVVCNPYKRKRDISKDQPTNQRQAYSGLPVANQSVPYKRQRDQSYNKTVDQMKLLHTPILADDRQ